MDAGRFDALTKGLATKGRLGGALAGVVTAAGFASAAAQDDDAADDAGEGEAVSGDVGATFDAFFGGETGEGVIEEQFDLVFGDDEEVVVEEEAEDETAVVAGDDTPSVAISDASGGDFNTAVTNDFIFVS